MPLSRFFKIGLALMSFVLLTACPAGHNYWYSYRGDQKVAEVHKLTRLNYDENTEIGVSCSHYISFVGDREKGVFVVIESDKLDHFDLMKQEIEVRSSVLGKIDLDHRPDVPYLDSLPTLYFKKIIDKKLSRSQWKSLDQDSISINFKNGPSYLFVREQL